MSGSTLASSQSFDLTIGLVSIVALVAIVALVVAAVISRGRHNHCYNGHVCGRAVVLPPAAVSDPTLAADVASLNSRLGEVETNQLGHEARLNQHATWSTSHQNQLDDHRRRLDDLQTQVQNTTHTVLHRAVGRPFNRVAAAIAGMVTFVLSAIAFGLMESHQLGISGLTGTRYVFDNALEHALFLRIVIVVVLTVLMATAAGFLVPGIIGGDDAHDQNQAP